MSTTTIRTSAPGPVQVEVGRIAGRTLRIDPPHAAPSVPGAAALAWTDYVQPSFANLPPVIHSSLAPGVPSQPAAPEATAADPRCVSRPSSPQPVLPARGGDRDARTGVRRQRFYPEQWRRLQQPAIDRLVNEHGQRLQWIGWERSLPQLYLPAGHLTRALLDLLQLTLRRTHSSGAGQAASASELPLCLRVGWQSGVMQSLVLVLEHPLLKLPPALILFANAPLAHAGRAAPEPPDAGELVRVRKLLGAIGGTIAVSRSRSGGTEFRLSLPVDDRTTLVRAWLEQAAHSVTSGATAATDTPATLGGELERRSAVYQSQISMFVVGRRQAETITALNRADADLQALSGRDDFVYRAARSRWLWLTTHDELPAFEPCGSWQAQLVSRWNCLIPATLLTEQQTAAFHGLARAIVARMDLVLGRRVPPLDTLVAPPPRSRLMRIDRAAASMPPRRSQAPAGSARSARVSQGRVPLGSVPPSMRRPRWRYPI